MSEKLLKATHQGKLKIGEKELQCAVLENGTRLLTQEGFLKALGRSGKPAAGRGSSVEKIAPFLALDNLKPFVDKELESSTFPILFQSVKGAKAYGYRAELLPKVCEVYLKARDEGALLKTQVKFAKACEILTRGLAHIGIIALVDEATGYQEVRDRLALQQILEQYISKELLAWAKRFPNDFYKQLFRLRNWQYSPLSMKRPSLVGRITNDIVYERLAPGVLAELKRINPITEKGYRKHKHHQWLTEDVGHTQLANHLYAVIGFMKASPNWQSFYRLLERAYPKLNQTLPLPFPELNEKGIDVFDMAKN